MTDRTFTERLPHYCMTAKHHGGTPGRAQWVLPEERELDLFYSCTDSEWFDANGTLWGVLPDAEPVGTANEIISKYPKPQNDFDSWHGYPVRPKDGRHDIPPVDLVKDWEGQQLIRKKTKIRILGGQI